MEKQLYQCPYNLAAKCNMENPCKGCEDFKPMNSDFAVYSGKIGMLQLVESALAYALEHSNLKKFRKTKKMELGELVAIKPEKKLHIIPNNPESGNVRLFTSSEHCEKCSPTNAFSNEYILKHYYPLVPNVVICIVCGHEQKITK